MKFKKTQLFHLKKRSTMLEDCIRLTGLYFSILILVELKNLMKLCTVKYTCDMWDILHNFVYNLNCILQYGTG